MHWSWAKLHREHLREMLQALAKGARYHERRKLVDVKKELKCKRGCDKPRQPTRHRLTHTTRMGSQGADVALRP